MMLTLRARGEGLNAAEEELFLLLLLSLLSHRAGDMPEQEAAALIPIVEAILKTLRAKNAES